MSTPPAVSSYPAASPSRLPEWSLIAICLVPLGIVLWQIILYSRNVVYWDEFQSVLEFILNINTADTWGQKLAYLVADHNEHRMLTSRLLFVALYGLTGQVNFVTIAWIGNFFLLALCAVLIFSVAPGARRFWLGVPLIFFLFQLQHHENLFWSGSSIDHFLVVFLAALALRALHQGTNRGLALGLGGAFLATFTLAHGLVVFPVGALRLAQRRQWTQLAIWLAVGGATGALFLHGLPVDSAHPLMIHSLAEIARLIHHGLTTLGAPLSLGEGAVAPYIGVAGVIIAAILGRRGLARREPFLRDFVLFLLGGIALIALGRASMGTASAMSSRYYVLPCAFWAIMVYGSLVAASPEGRPWRLLSAMLPLLLAFNLVASARAWHEGASFAARREIAAQWFQLSGSFKNAPEKLYPEPELADRVLAQASRQGIYRLPPALSRRVSLPTTRTLPGEPLAYYVDKIEVTAQMVYVRGWVFDPGAKSSLNKIHLTLQGAEDMHYYTTLRERRRDIAQAYQDDRLLFSGFQFGIPRQQLANGTYSLGFLIVRKGKGKSIGTDHRLHLEAVSFPATAQHTRIEPPATR